MAHRILITEDQPDICKLIRMTLEFGDFEIHEAHDGETGLSMAPRWPLQIPPPVATPNSPRQDAWIMRVQA